MTLSSMSSSLSQRQRDFAALLTGSWDDPMSEFQSNARYLLEGKWTQTEGLPSMTSVFLSISGSVKSNLFIGR